MCQKQYKNKGAVIRLSSRGSGTRSRELVMEDSGGLGAVRHGLATTGDRQGQDAQTVLVTAAFPGQMA